MELVEGSTSRFCNQGQETPLPTDREWNFFGAELSSEIDHTLRSIYNRQARVLLFSSVLFGNPDSSTVKDFYLNHGHRFFSEDICNWTKRSIKQRNEVEEKRTKEKEEELKKRYNLERVPEGEPFIPIPVPTTDEALWINVAHKYRKDQQWADEFAKPEDLESQLKFDSGKLSVAAIELEILMRRLQEYQDSNPFFYRYYHAPAKSKNNRLVGLLRGSCEGSEFISQGDFEPQPRCSYQQEVRALLAYSKLTPLGVKALQPYFGHFLPSDVLIDQFDMHPKSGVFGSKASVLRLEHGIFLSELSTRDDTETQEQKGNPSQLCRPTISERDLDNWRHMINVLKDDEINGLLVSRQK